MALGYPEILDRLLDNANLGKVVTDVGSGFALSISILMLTGLWTGISIVPADQVRQLNSEIKTIESELQKEKVDLRPLLEEAAQLGTMRPLEKIYDPEVLYSLARRQIAHLSARIAVLDARIDAVVKGAGAAGKSLEELSLEKANLASLNDRLVTQRETSDDWGEQLRTLRNRLQDAQALGNNVEVFTNNVSAVLAFGVVFGIVLSQISRLVFVTWIYDRLLKRDPRKNSLTKYIKEGKVKKEDHDALVTHYYRYVEGSTNMILPVLAFGLVFPSFANQHLVLLNPVSPWLIGVVALVLAAPLASSGFYTYRRFRQKEDELLAA